MILTCPQYLLDFPTALYTPIVTDTELKGDSPRERFFGRRPPRGETSVVASECNQDFRANETSDQKADLSRVPSIRRWREKSHAEKQQQAPRIAILAQRIRKGYAT